MESEYNFKVLEKRELKKFIEALLSAPGERPETLRDKNYLRGMLYGDKILTIIAELGDRIVGSITANWTISWPPDISLITIIDQESARKGLGLFLIDHLLSVLRRRFPRIPYVTTRLTKENTDAISLYSAKGFTVEGFLREGLMGRDVVFMKKDFMTNW